MVKLTKKLKNFGLLLGLATHLAAASSSARAEEIVLPAQNKFAIGLNSILPVAKNQSMLGYANSVILSEVGLKISCSTDVYEGRAVNSKRVIFQGCVISDDLTDQVEEQKWTMLELFAHAANLAQ